MPSQVTHPIDIPKRALKEGKRKLRPMPLLDEGLVLAACDREGIKRYGNADAHTHTSSDCNSATVCTF